MQLSHMVFRQILFEVDNDGIALATVNRPEKRNALNQEVMAELDAAAKLAEGSGEIRGWIITGAGDKAFVAGADIAEMANLDAEELREFSRRGQAVMNRIEGMGKPSVAAINGYALGGGLELALACTIRVAATTARMGLPEVKLGLIPGYGGTQRLPRVAGYAKALEWMITGQMVEAEDALRAGLVNYVVPCAELVPFSRNLLRKILANGPLAVRAVMRVTAAGMEAENEAFGRVGASLDAREGMAAFLEKRPPRFTGQ